MRGPGRAAWVVGTPLGLLAWAALVWGLVALEPARLVPLLRPALARGGWSLVVEDLRVDRGEGWTLPGAWRWRAHGVALIGTRPGQPSILLDDVTLSLPRVTLLLHPRRVVFDEVSVGTASLHFDGTRPDVPPPLDPDAVEVRLPRVTLAAFSLTMAGGPRRPEVIVDATDVAVHGGRIAPGQRAVDGTVTLAVAQASVAGVPLRQLHATRLDLVDGALHADLDGRLGDHRVRASLSVAPLIGKPRVIVDGTLRGGTLGGLARAMLDPSLDVDFVGGVEARVHLVTGPALGRGKLEGTATVEVVGAGVRLSAPPNPVLIAAARLAPFLRLVDDARGRVLDIGNLDGEVAFDEHGITLHDVNYAAPHSDAHLDGYIRSNALSARLHFHPRPRSGAIEWGLILRGALTKPRIALAVPPMLRAWTPCDDPLDCPVRGGAPRASTDPDATETERELDRAANRARAEARHADASSDSSTRRARP